MIVYCLCSLVVLRRHIIKVYCTIYKSDYDNAIKAYSKAIKIDPSYAYALNDRGSCYRALEDYDKAITDYLEASKNDPQAFIFNNLASAYRKAGDTDLPFTIHQSHTVRCQL